MIEDHARDPQLGDFDAELEALRPEDIQYFEASPGGEIVLQLGVRGEDAVALERLALERGEEMSEVVASLIRAASRSAA
jgi:hypothetical protein